MDEFSGENATDKIMEKVDIDFNSENVAEKIVEEEEIVLVDIEFSGENLAKEIVEEEEEIIEKTISPIEEVRLAVPTTDNLELLVLTFQVWFLGMMSCILLSCLNNFFRYHTEPLLVSMIFVQLVTLPIGKFLAKVLPYTKFCIHNTRWEFTLKLGPFNIKEHILISSFANTKATSGGGTAYAVNIMDVIQLFYLKKITFFAS
ncbi:hypothetical protein SLE2022_078520 [Rubroshorea leprosula]